MTRRRTRMILIVLAAVTLLVGVGYVAYYELEYGPRRDRVRNNIQAFELIADLLIEVNGNEVSTVFGVDKLGTNVNYKFVGSYYLYNYTAKERVPLSVEQSAALFDIAENFFKHTDGNDLTSIAVWEGFVTFHSATGVHEVVYSIGRKTSVSQYPEREGIKYKFIKAKSGWYYKYMLPDEWPHL